LYESSFEIRLDYKPSTGKADRVFLAMAAYVTAFENLTFTVGKSLDANLNFTYELSGVESGSLKSIIKCKAGLEKVAGALSSIPRFIASSMIELDNYDSEEAIEKSAKGVENELLELGAAEFPNQVNIDRYRFAKDIKGLCQASELLAEGETIDLKSSGADNVILLNTGVRFEKDVDELFEECHTNIKKTETLHIKSPVFLGDSQWDFKSVERNVSFSANFEHVDWLERYQKGDLGHLDPGDALIAFISYDAIRLKGLKSFSYKNYKILHVERVIRGAELQIRIEEAQQNSEKN
jgi:hypothetical protein